MKILTQFKVSFSVLHDSDSPRIGTGVKANSAWSENAKVEKLSTVAREKGLKVVHRISVPDFEGALGLPAKSSHKPFRVWKSMRKDPAKSAEIKKIFDDLRSPESVEQPHQGEFMDGLILKVKTWADVHASGDPRYNFGALELEAAVAVEED